MTQTELYRAFEIGSYANPVDFWDDLLDMDRDWLETNKAKRQALYPFFKEKVRLIGDFELDLAIKYFLDGNKKGLKRIGDSLNVRARQAYIYNKQQEQNERFSNLFNLVEVI